MLFNIYCEISYISQILTAHRLKITDIKYKISSKANPTNCHLAFKNQEIKKARHFSKRKLEVALITLAR